MSNVLVFGGMGRTGRLIAALAAEDGHSVTIASRHSSSDRAGHGIRSIQADVTDTASARAALDGQDAVILAVSTTARRPGGLYSAAARSIVEVAAFGTRAIVISSGGVYRDDPALPFWYRRLLIPLVMNDLYVDMAEMEAVVRSSALDWTIVRASYLRDDPATAAYRVVDGATPARGWRLSRADLARFTADQLRSDEWVRRTPTLAL